MYIAVDAAMVELDKTKKEKWKVAMLRQDSVDQKDAVDLLDDETEARKELLRMQGWRHAETVEKTDECYVFVVKGKKIVAQTVEALVLAEKDTCVRRVRAGT